MRFGIVCCVLILIVMTASAQSLPKRELRGVYITTTSGLDWPKSYDAAEQQQSLREMILSMREANLNAIFFQVRARGDAYYRSAYEPWAENLTGTLGKNPGWDPLAFVIQHAHDAGMEVHAWFNVYKIRGAGPPAASSPHHPARAFPDWVVRYEDEQWFDPGEPEVTDYILTVLRDLAQHYDLDGICFDFIRYPGRDFPDRTTYRKFGRGLTLDEWRQENINDFVRRAYNELLRVNPMLKVGAAPLGNFGGALSAQPNTKIAAGAVSDFLQNSRSWLKNGWLDYLAPQVYWTLEFETRGPDFAYLTNSWMKDSGGRHIYVSIGAYRPEILAQLPDQIISSRKLKTSGQVFFRYENVASTDFRTSYPALAIPPSMPWKDSIPPLAPTNPQVMQKADRTVQLQWRQPARARDGDEARFYAVYRFDSPQFNTNNPGFLLGRTSQTNFTDTNAEASRPLYYVVTAFDKGNNESSPLLLKTHQ
ncbi:MAG: family 10 glycosylhydrolase [Ignavibacteriae bacterium]|nr:family 10 glycosylhydrolase [Ignavibacteriota bacterium]